LSFNSSLFSFKFIKNSPETQTRSKNCNCFVPSHVALSGLDGILTTREGVIRGVFRAIWFLFCCFRRLQIILRCSVVDVFFSMVFVAFYILIYIFACIAFFSGTNTPFYDEKAAHVYLCGVEIRNEEKIVKLYKSAVKFSQNYTAKARVCFGKFLRFLAQLSDTQRWKSRSQNPHLYLFVNFPMTPVLPFERLLYFWFEVFEASFSTKKTSIHTS